MSSELPSKINFWDGRQQGATQSNGNGSFPSHITGALTIEQMNAYQVMFRINEITSILNAPTVTLPKSFTRLPPPPPVYDASGKRVNTDEQRYRKALEDERYRLVETALKVVPFFSPPPGYVKPTKFQDKYYIPVEQYPGVNFVGLLLGPRGNTLRKLQEDSKCKIAIRGRGSIKEGKHTADLPKGAANMDDPLHCLIIGDSEEKVQNGVKACQTVVVTAVTSPEGQNDLKRGQLRELAELNGTLREDDRPCTVCGLKGHLKYDCPNRQSFAQQVICNNCGQPGHITRDCPLPRQDYRQTPPPGLPQANTGSYPQQQQASRYSQGTSSRYGGNGHADSNAAYGSRYTPRNAIPQQGRYENAVRNHVPAGRYGELSYNEGTPDSRRARTPTAGGTSSVTPLETTVENKSTSANVNGVQNTESVPPGLGSDTGLPDILTTSAPPGLDASNAPPGLDSIAAPPGFSPTNAPPGLDPIDGPPGLGGVPGLTDGNDDNKPQGLNCPPGL